MFCEEQSHFREGHCPVTAVTHVSNLVYDDNMNCGRLTGVAFLDLKKAFISRIISEGSYVSCSIP